MRRQEFPDVLAVAPVPFRRAGVCRPANTPEYRPLAAAMHDPDRGSPAQVRHDDGSELKEGFDFDFGSFGRFHFGRCFGRFCFEVEFHFQRGQLPSFLIVRKELFSRFSVTA